jgi:hypothetical protein
MKTVKMLVCVLLTFLAVLLLGSCGQGKYVPKPNEELYGTWINEGIRYHKLVVFAGGVKEYLGVADAEPDMETTEQISAKWKDGDGNIWYKTFELFISGHLKGIKMQYLWKISNGSQMELTGMAVKDFNEKSFPLDLTSDRLADHRTYQKR